MNRQPLNQLNQLSPYQSKRSASRPSLREESGQSLIAFSIFLTILIGILGLVLDLGYSNVIQKRMQMAADAAALAGARDLAAGESESTAISRMQQILAANKADTSLSSYTVTNGSVTEVMAIVTVPTLVSGLFGIDEIEIDAYASAATGQIQESDNLMPFITQEDDWVVGQPVTLMGDKNGPGNFGWVRWAGQNPSTPTLRSNIDNPSQSDTVAIGDRVNGHPGVSFNPVQGNLNAWIGKTVTVILYDPAETQGNGNNLTYKTRGFAYFVITGTHSHGNDSEIYGTFVSKVTIGGTINPGVTTGAQGIALLK